MPARSASAALSLPSPRASKTSRRGARHERWPDERLGARVGMLAIDEDRSRPHAAKRLARRFVRLGIAWLVSDQLDGGAEQRGGERVDGEDQYVVSAHVVVPARGSQG